MSHPAAACTDHDHSRCIDAALDKAAELCAARGVRLTALRRRVLELVWRDHAAVKAYDLLRELDAEYGAAAKPPTVYRALDFLIEQGLVHRLESLHAFVGCAVPDCRHDGQFLICDRCGGVSEVAAATVSAAIADQACDLGFRIAQQTVEVRGLCQRCRSLPDEPVR